MYQDYIYPALFLGYLIGFIISSVILPFKKRIFSFFNVIFCLILSIILIALPGSFIIFIFGFASDSSSNFDKLYQLNFPFFIGFFIILIPIALIKFVIFIINHHKLKH